MLNFTPDLHRLIILIIESRFVEKSVPGGADFCLLDSPMKSVTLPKNVTVRVPRQLEWKVVGMLKYLYYFINKKMK